MAEITNCNCWDEIDLSERYMVCGLFSEACSLASTQIRYLRTSSLKLDHEMELSEMMVAAGMVFVQSLKESGRTSEMFAELKVLFSSVEAIPIDVFLTGVCMQISEGTTSNLSAIFEEFLDNWRYVDNDRYILRYEEHFSKCPWQSALDSEKYLEVIEAFTMIFLGRVLGKHEIAISWTKKLDLPEDRRQDMLRRLHAMNVLNSSSFTSPALFQAVGRVGLTPTGVESPSRCTNLSSNTDDSKHTMTPIKYLTDRSSPFWWFTTVHFKFGVFHVVLPRGRIVLVGLLMVFASYFFQKKASVLRRFASRLGLSIRRALIDAWQLAFSIQVNPLSAVQQVSSSPRTNM